jgi:hypothetical protein
MYPARFFRASARKWALAAGLLLGTAASVAGEVDNALSGWLGREITIETSSFADRIPVGGKLTFVYDSGDDIVRVCTRNAPGQRRPWKMDLSAGCNVAMNFTRGERYCSLADVKAGNGEVLSTCHRLRSRDVALKPSAVRGGVELQDVIVFLVPAAGNKHAIAILVDSPSRVTDEGSATGKD